MSLIRWMKAVMIKAGIKSPIKRENGKNSTENSSSAIVILQKDFDVEYLPFMD